MRPSRTTRSAGSTGCNRFTGAVHPSTATRSSSGTLASTRMACAPPGDAIERAYLAVLERVTEWRMDDAELVLLDGDDAELLRFVGATPVGDWEATVIETGNALASPLAGTRDHRELHRRGHAHRLGGLQHYRTTFETERRRHRPRTRRRQPRSRAQTPEGVMEQEAAYLAALPTAAAYRVDGDSLALLRADGTYVASFLRATP